MEASAMPGGTTSPSPLPPPARPPSPRIPSRTTNTAPPLLHQSTSPIGSPITSMPSTMEQGGQAVGDLGQNPVGGISIRKETSWPSSKKKRKKILKDETTREQYDYVVAHPEEEAGKTNGETQQSEDARVERQITSKTHVDQWDSSKVPISETIGGKRSLPHASESSRARKTAKIISAKVEKTQLKNSKTPRRKMSPIVSRSPIINMIARRKAQSPTGTSKSLNLHARSPNLHARFPNQAGTSKSPNLHDLSPAPTHGSPTNSHDLSPAATNGSKRRPRKLTSIIWKDAEPIYIDGLLMQGRCNYCSTVFPASKVSGTSQLARHLKVCEVKCSMDGVIQKIRTSDEIDPDWKFDQQAARVELVKLIVLHGLPFSFVEYAGFRNFCAALNPWFKSVSRVTVQNEH